MIRALLLDLDNTLYDYESCNQPAVDAMLSLAEQQLHIPKATLAIEFASARDKVKHWLPSVAAAHSRLLYLQTMIEKLTGKTHPSVALSLHDSFWSVYFSHMKLHAGVKDALRAIKEKGITIIVLTDLTTEIQLKKLVHLGIADLIDSVVTSEEAGADKPHPKMFLRALQKAGCTAAECLVVGDNVEADIVGAQQAGMRCALVKGAEDLHKVFAELR
jgi:HAD superfamily hydrolase (TIGR01662 family)